MALQTINVGAAANDGTGDPLRTAFQKVNSNFAEIASGVISKVTLTQPASSATLTIDDGKTFRVSATLTFQGADASTVVFGGGGTVLYSGGPLGTPSSGTLTNCTGLPVAGIAPSTTAALGAGSVELGHASDTTLSRLSAGVVAVEGVELLRSGGDAGTPSAIVLTNASGVAPNLTAGAVTTINGKLAASTNVTITGTGTSADPYTISAAGGSGGTPGGSNTQVQFNDASAFGGSANLTWSSPNLTIGAQQAVQGGLVLANSAAGAYATTLRSSNSATAASVITLPPAPPAADDYVLSAKTTGVTSWVAQTGGGSGTVNSGTAGQLAQYPANGTAVSGLTAAAEALKYLTDGTPQLYKLDRSEAAADANGIFTIVKFKRTDGTLAMQSVLSGGSSPAYTTRTVTRYAADGTTVVSTTVLTLTYDGSNNLISEA